MPYRPTRLKLQRRPNQSRLHNNPTQRDTNKDLTRHYQQLGFLFKKPGRTAIGSLSDC